VFLLRGDPGEAAPSRPAPTRHPPWWVQAARDVARAVVPVHCPGCGLSDVRWCEDCEAPWWESPLRSESAAPRLDIPGQPALPVWAITSLAGTSHAMVSAWKDASRRDLDGFFAAAARRGARDIADHVAPQTTVVPVPARPRSTRRRGIDLPLLLAESAAAGLRDAGVDARVAAVLTIGSGEQPGASARERWRQASSVRAVLPHGVSGRALLVDDVVTTGATIAAATRALDVTFLTVAAGFCLASAPASGAPTARPVV
jgi:predicted amidophosphoribosyltransferase